MNSATVLSTATRARLTPRRLLLAAGAGAALSALAWWLPPARIAVWHWRVQLLTAGDSAAARLVERIAGQGEYGLEALAVLVGSPRSRVVEAARAAIRREIDGWPQLDSATCATARTAAGAGAGCPGRPAQPAGPADCLGLCHADSGEENSATGAERQEIVAACERVLRAAVLERRQMLLARGERSAADDETSENSRYDPDDEAFLRQHLKSLPGGGLP